MQPGLDVQLQMRRNVEQMHRTADELASFTSEISRRDRSLRGLSEGGGREGVGEDEGNEEEEEAREIAAAKEELRRLAAEQIEAPTHSPPLQEEGGSRAKTHAQKYTAWERYDAEGVVERMEEREREEEALRREVLRLESKRSQAAERKRQMLAEASSDALRLQGNSAFNSARYEEVSGRARESRIGAGR